MLTTPLAREPDVDPHTPHDCPAACNVYFNDGDKEPDLKIQGNFRAKEFTVTKMMPGRDAVVAVIKRQGMMADGLL